MPEVMYDCKKFITFLERRHSAEQYHILTVGIPIDLAEIILDYSYISLDALTFIISMCHEADISIHYDNYPNKETFISRARYALSFITNALASEYLIVQMRVLILGICDAECVLELIVIVDYTTYVIPFHLNTVLYYINHGGIERLCKKISQSNSRLRERPIRRALLTALRVIFDSVLWVSYSLFDSVSYKKAIEMRVHYFNNRIYRHPILDLGQYMNDASSVSRQHIKYTSPQLMCVPPNKIKTLRREFLFI